MKLAWDSKKRIDSHDGRYHRVRSGDLYHTARWTRLSRMYRDNHPLCAECARNGRIVAATCVDHIVPYPICADFFFDESNLQALCDKCNHEKGQKDKKTINEWRNKNE